MDNETKTLLRNINQSLQNIAVALIALQPFYAEYLKNQRKTKNVPDTLRQMAKDCEDINELVFGEE